MQSSEVQLARATRNLRVLANSASRLSLKERVESASVDLPSVDLPGVGLPSVDFPIGMATPRKHDGAEVSSLADSGVPRSSSGITKKGRAAVVCWDLSHNPAGRALVLYQLLEQDWQVDLIGPIWSRYGSELWAPLRNLGLNIRSFPCDNFLDFLPKANLLCASTQYDVVYICKPRLPSIYIGAAIKKHSRCPVVLDVDDFELSFFENESTASFEEFSKNISFDFEPYDELGTRYSQGLVGEFDGLTVSNLALAQKFGGQIVRHARDEKIFRPDAARRSEARSSLGISEDQLALMFIGTPRPHKGIFEVAKALDSLDDPSIVFHIIGTIKDQSLKARFLQYPRANIVFHDDCLFSDLVFYLSAADLVPLIQNPRHPISQFQIPAKISDASSLGIPVLATDTPPLRDLHTQGGLDIVEISELASKILEHKASCSPPHAESRHFFLGELSLAVNRSRAALALDEAIVDNSPLSEKLSLMFELLNQVYRNKRVEDIHSATKWSDVKANSVKTTSPTGSLQRVIPSLVSGIFSKTIAKTFTKTSTTKKNADCHDIVFFWKQNDTGLFGRRSDMVVKYLLQSPKVGKILQLDAPYDANMTDRLVGSKAKNTARQPGDCSVTRLHDRFIHLEDSENLHRRTFIRANSDTQQAAIEGSRVVSSGKDYADYVLAEMNDFGMQPENTLAWFCPVIWDAISVIEEINFKGVVSDLIDDQRAWENQPAGIIQLEKNYADIIKSSDLVIANCDALASAFNKYCSDIHVIPNGAERHTEFGSAELPVLLRDVPRPIIGYVGTLRDRIDWLLLEDVVTDWPQASFVFIGPGEDSAQARQLAKHTNVFMLGAISYAEIAQYLRCLDVAMVPHLKNKLTERMNPLKLYNYFAAGVPVVTTDLKNIDDLRTYITIANSSTDFVTSLREAVEIDIDTASVDWNILMDKISWETRVGGMVDALDTTFGDRPLKAVGAP